MIDRPQSRIGDGPVAPLADTPLRPAATMRIERGFWADRQAVNRTVALRDGYRQLHEAGNVANLRAAALGAPPTAGDRAAEASASGFGASSPGYRGPLFMDSDVYKWLEAVGWERQRADDPELAAWEAELAELVRAAQQPDGYLDSFVQVVTGDRWTHLDFSHELYCAGHLLQAAVAVARGSGEPVLGEVASRFAALIDDTFGPGRREQRDGHPVVEMALVEWYRQTGDRRFLDAATWAVESRGRDAGEHPAHRVYGSERVPVREAEHPEGHAVRALYLAAGATDVAIETGDAELLDALERQWERMVESQLYVTGGAGSRWEGEAFGDPWELPPDRAYAETCAAIASIQWSWRLLLATGRTRYADLIERTLFNGMLAGVGLGGDEFFYANALQVRADTTPSTDRDAALGRRRWFSTACCPPNAMRTLAQLGHYAATADEHGVQLHQYAAGSVHSAVATLRVETGYPYDGDVLVTVERADPALRTLSLRIPAWAEGATVETPDGPVAAVAGEAVAVDRAWAAGDEVRLRLPVGPRAAVSDPRVDATRGCVVVEAGPLVYCVESVDAPGVDLDGIAVDRAVLAPGSLAATDAPELLGGTATIAVPLAGGGTATAIPYALWANRELGAMRVWLPLG